MFHFFGKICPIFKLLMKPYCFCSSLLLWFGVLSIDPNPIVDIFPETEIFAKSAKFASKAASADHPPSPSISESLSSLNQTSALKVSPIFWDGFLSPIIKFLTDPIVGFPLIANLYFLSPGRLDIFENSSIISSSSLKYTASFELIWFIASALIFVNFSREKSIEFESGFQTSSALNLLELPLLYDVGFKGISIW